MDQLSFSGAPKEGTIIFKDNPDLFEAASQPLGKIVSDSAGGQFWTIMILSGMILASLSLYLVKSYEKNFIEKRGAN